MLYPLSYEGGLELRIAFLLRFRHGGPSPRVAVRACWVRRMPIHSPYPCRGSRTMRGVLVLRVA